MSSKSAPAFSRLRQIAWWEANGPFSSPSGISSTGLGIFGPHDRFPGNNLQGPDSPAGVQFGIIPAADNLLTGNGGLSGNWLISNRVVFRLSGFSAEPDAAISDVVFQYGTGLDEPQYGGDIPEPSSFVLAALGLVGLVVCRRRRLLSKALQRNPIFGPSC